MIAGREGDVAGLAVLVPGHAVAGLLVEDLDVVEGVAVGGALLGAAFGDVVGVQGEAAAVAGTDVEGVGGIVVALCRHGIAGIAEEVVAGALGSVRGLLGLGSRRAYSYREFYVASRQPVVWSVRDVVPANQGGGICCRRSCCNDARARPEERTEKHWRCSESHLESLVKDSERWILGGKKGNLQGGEGTSIL